MAPRFRERGLTCDVVALLRTPSPLEHLLERQDVNLRYTGVQRLYSPRQISSLAKLLRGYDIAHVHLFPAQLWAVVAAARLKPSIPLVTTEHGTWNARRRWWFRPVDIWMYPHYKHIACISEATADRTDQMVPRHRRKDQRHPQRYSSRRIRNRPAGCAASSAVRRCQAGFCRTFLYPRKIMRLSSEL